MFWVLVLFGILTAVHESLTVYWLRSFEARRVAQAVLVGMVLEAGTWGPISFLNATDSYGVPIACTLGAGLGIYLGLRRSTGSSTSPETDCNGRDRLGGSIERKLLQTSLDGVPL